MKKRIRKQKLNVKASHSKLMLRNLLESLLTYGKVETTKSKAKVLKSYADQKLSYILQSESKKIDNRIVSSLGSVRLSEKALKFVNFLRKQEKSNKSGFTSVVRTRYRKGDNALMIEVSLIGFDDFVKASKPIKKKVKKVKSTKAESTSTKAKSTAKKQEKVVKKKVVKKEITKKPVVSGVEKKRDEGFISKLSERFLGRKSKGPSIDRKSRARSRSGL